MKVNICPLCGGKSYIDRDYVTGNYSVHCCMCHVHIHGGNSESKLLDKWNKRVKAYSL